MRWSLAPAEPNAACDPRQLDALSLDWRDARVPGTVAQALDTGYEPPFDPDDRDWWYRTTFDDAGAVLVLHGLATLAEVWLDGERVVQSENMFVRHRVDLRERERAPHELAICFRSLNAALAKKRPRPRWKTKLVRQQQLRWVRTTLMGRIPGWTPPVPAVGPWRAIEVTDVWDLELRTSVDGTIALSCSIAGDARGTFVAGDARAELHVDGERVTATLRIDAPRLWWPHTHGEPALYACRLELRDGRTIDCGSVGFRGVERDGDFGLRINGEPLFCRGACWTPLDVVSLNATRDDYARTLTLMRDAGANMIRVGGTMPYEDDVFYALCDELGILVWQDFAFANLDYPADDETFVANVRDEAAQQLRRLRAHPSVVVWCGNSEVEQQAAMLGMPRESWRNRLFGDVLPALCAELHDDSVYVPSTPSEGVLPFQTNTGLAHYYGVGAYLRPLSDVRLADVRFTPECLGFANVPERDVVDAIFGGETPAPLDARWKRRTPRDSGAGWDFEDVRDHYLRAHYCVDPHALRYADAPRYLALSRVVTGEVMAQVYSEWRRAGSTCRGALVWFLRDLWPGAGWGILDSRGAPKACYYALRRVWQPRTIVLTDEGLNGIYAHALNETSEPLDATLELTLLRDGHVVVARASTPITLPPRSAQSFSAEALLGGFHDTSYAYRFGAPQHDVTIATLLVDDIAIAEAFHFPQPPTLHATNANVITEAARDGDDWLVTLQSDRFLHAAHIDARGFAMDDDYVHVAPGRAKTIRLRGNAAFDGYLEALNLADAVKVAVRT
ncbi:MAG: glycoside hydrolase family 2 protein [Acidobacteria bacterium]|nr:glycoside hydrolase family 2 protein [Acidobacteriota bacterium]MBV9478748.1 glycoside hydrolase family 2 protein [Acidobacteriota bacterium]